MRVFDGEWMGPVIDHYSSLLIKYAEQADFEIHENPFKAKQHGIDLSSMSDNQKLENAQSLMENLFRSVNQANQGKLSQNKHHFVCV